MVVGADIVTLVGGTATALQLGAASGVSLDVAGNLYIADSGNHAIWKRTAATGTAHEGRRRALV